MELDSSPATSNRRQGAPCARRPRGLEVYRRALLWAVGGALFLPAAGVFAASEAEGGKPFYVSSTIWAILSFLVVLTLLLRKVFPKILGALDERARDIRAGLEAAERARAEAEEMMKRHQDDIAQARAEAAGIVEEAKADATKLHGSILAKAKKDAEEVTQRSLREIEQAKTTAIDALQRRSAELAVDIAGALIDKNLNAEEHEKLIAERLERFDDFRMN